MLQHAAELGANAVVAARYDATEVMQGVTEVLAGWSPGVRRACEATSSWLATEIADRVLEA